ncbi:AraC family transcriptional regulator [Robertkochia solimangrovi]|uniref:AraC family transcriptional regulator n=1 Tax=Robertkochia solimangrovi TaxID=2213046 RepID=UPI001180492A|nr:AraC family transcriptional regulator [Robertkochia solimangrovi]TRZ43515.1 AraC family transcriptional regulator [Robertkochia solimangrovi]
MKVLPFKIPKQEQQSLVYQEDRVDVFYDQLHQHEEIQISYIVKGYGSIIVGDTISSYEPNDVLVIGGNVPHVFKSDPDMSPDSVMLTLFFTRNSFGRDFFNSPELREMEAFFKESELGLILPASKKLAIRFNKLHRMNRIKRVASLLNIIDTIMNAKRSKLSTFVYGKKYTDDEGKRMSAVFQHAMENFHEQISLEEIAEKASMTRNAFCRYFKKRTNKTFFQFLIEIRIENACKLLYKNKDMPIASVAELCGFQNITNFNRKFKELKGVTPSQYRSQF